MKHFFLLLALCAVQLIVVAQPVISKVYGPGSSWQSEPKYMALAADSGYFMAGGKGNPNGGGDALLIRVNKFGDTLWTAGFGTPFPDGLGGVAVTSDGGCVVVGTINLSFIQQNVARLTVARYNATGQLQWIKSYSPTGYNADGTSILALPDGSFIVTGVVYTSPQYTNDPIVCHITAQGGLIWSNYYRLASGTMDDFTRSRLCPDGNILLVGSIGGPSVAHTMTLLTKIDTAGNVIWARKVVSATDNLGVWDVALKPGGGFVITGLSSAGQSLECFAIGFNSTGDTTFTAHYGSTVNLDWGYGITPSQHGFVICGVTESFSPSPDAWLMEIDTMGQLLWSRGYGDGNWQEARFVLQSPGGGYTIAAREQGQPGAYRFWFFKTDSAGVGGLCNEYATPTIQGFQPASSIPTSLSVIPAGQEVIENLTTWRGVPYFNNCIITTVNEENENALNIFPNPAQDELRLTNVVNDAVIKVTDAFGKTIALSSTINERTLLLNTSGLASGVYFVSVINPGGGISSGKFVICR